MTLHTNVTYGFYLPILSTKKYVGNYVRILIWK